MSPERRGRELTRTAPRAQDRRQGNRIVYVVAEGEGTEYDYLGRLNQAYGSNLRFLIRFPRQTRGLSASQVVDEAARARASGESDVDFWALFDHDGRPDIDQACARAVRIDIHAALSHPSFELWLLLHFQEFAPAKQGGRSKVIIERLRAAHPAFADYGRGSKRIDARRFEALSEHDNIAAAVTRARKLSATLSNETPSNRDPSTDVYLLIEALGIVDPPDARRTRRGT